MSDSYLDGKVREALLTAKGSRSLAQATLMKWAAGDDRLLKAMAQPFLKAISGAAIVAAIKRGVSVPGLSLPPAKAPPKLSQTDLMQVLSQLGGGDVAGEGRGDGRGDGRGAGGGLSAADILGGAPAAKPTAPQRRPGAAKPTAPADQASTIRTLAAVYARNRKRP
ncbi:MAG: hypothetical protein WCO00_11030 [Rhodospirillaceae bacterium]